MKYLSTTIALISTKPTYLILFILFNLIGLPVAIMTQIGMVKGGLSIVLMIAVYVLDLFLTTGVYSISWKHLNGGKASLITDSKKYFQQVLGVSIVVGIILTIIIFPFSIAHKMLFLSDIPAEVYGKRLDSNLIRTIPVVFVRLSFVYAIPAIFACNLSGKDAITNSWKFLLENMAKSKVVVICLLLSTTARILFTQWAVNFEYSSANYWQIITANNIVSYVFSFVIFLCAAQIFKENFQKSESHITSK